MSTQIKCLVWDLDNTIWHGTLMEKGRCRLKPGIRQILEEVDRRGILLSIASTNDKLAAVEVLKRKGLNQFFLCPQITWVSKISSIQVIAKDLRIGLDSIGFVDDEPYELEQVRQIMPVVSTYPAAEYRTLLSRPELNPEFRTRESSQRRSMYMQEAVRAEAQARQGKSHREFLKYCQTRLTIRKAKPEDLPRIMELQHRTHQLNATGMVYDESTIKGWLTNAEFMVYVAELKDRFVNYGKIGVAICACRHERWELLTFLLSCRVLTRGIGSFFLAWLQHETYKSGAQELHGHFIARELNHRMKILYTLAGFRPRRKAGDGSVDFIKRCNGQLHMPNWLDLVTESS